MFEREIGKLFFFLLSAASNRSTGVKSSEKKRTTASLRRIDFFYAVGRSCRKRGEGGEIDCDLIANLKTLPFSSLEVDLTFCQHGFDIEVTLDGVNSLFISKCGGCGIVVWLVEA